MADAQKRRVLFVSHNHPSVVPGGAETYALELYEGMRRSAAFEPLLLSRIGPPHVASHNMHSGTVISRVNDDPNQYLFYTGVADFNWLMMTPRRKDVCTRFFREFLESYRPDLVHFQHTMFFGLDVLLQTRHTLPRAPIVYTLHEYLPICHRDGQMVRAPGGELCLEASPPRCHACFPDIAPQEFFLRKRLISTHFSHVDLFLAPSRFLLERFVDWGIDRERIRFEEYGRLPAAPVAETPRPLRNRFGFFGQLTEFKGIQVLLEAMQMLTASGNGTTPQQPPHLWIHGANLEFTPAEFQQKFQRLLDDNRMHVTFVGRYDHKRLPQLMADIDWVVVPSIWWENSPLVIQEAYAHGRPVICSNIGGMAEKVENGVNGLHFRVNDPVNLAEVLRTAATSPNLWDTLRAGICPIHSMDQHVTNVERFYGALLGD